MIEKVHVASWPEACGAACCLLQDFYILTVAAAILMPVLLNVAPVIYNVY